MDHHHRLPLPRESHRIHRCVICYYYGLDQLLPLPAYHLPVLPLFCRGCTRSAVHLPAYRSGCCSFTGGRTDRRRRLPRRCPIFATTACRLRYPFLLPFTFCPTLRRLGDFRLPAALPFFVCGGGVPRPHRCRAFATVHAAYHHLPPRITFVMDYVRSFYGFILDITYCHRCSWFCCTRLCLRSLPLPLPTTLPLVRSVVRTCRRRLFYAAADITFGCGVARTTYGLVRTDHYRVHTPATTYLCYHSSQPISLGCHHCRLRCLRSHFTHFLLPFAHLGLPPLHFLRSPLPCAVWFAAATCRTLRSFCRVLSLRSSTAPFAWFGTEKGRKEGRLRAATPGSLLYLRTQAYLPLPPRSVRSLRRRLVTASCRLF